MKKMNKKYLIYWVNIILLMLNTALLVFFYSRQNSLQE